MVSSLAPRSHARLGLEYMTPGEVTCRCRRAGPRCWTSCWAARDLRAAPASTTTPWTRRALSSRCGSSSGARGRGDALAARARDAERRRALDALGAEGQAEALARAAPRGRARAPSRGLEPARGPQGRAAASNREHGALLAHKTRASRDLRASSDDAGPRAARRPAPLQAARRERGLARRVEEGAAAPAGVARMRGEVVRVMGLGAEFFGLARGRGGREKKGGDADADAGRDAPSTTTVALLLMLMMAMRC